MKLSQDKTVLNGILFGAEEVKVSIGDKLDVVYSLNQDSWNGNRKLQLKIKDLNAF
jgi:hypothetical protein